MGKTSPRHKKEKDELLQRLNRGSKKWNASHPRHRLLDALWAFTQYYDRNHEDLKKWKRLYGKVPSRQRALLERTTGYSAKLKQVEHRLAENQRLCQRIVENALEFYRVDRSELDAHIKLAMKNKAVADKVSVSQALKHFVRDWSEEGRVERAHAFPHILAALETVYPERDGGEPVKVLLPGSGLGRLGHEVSALGGKLCAPYL